MNLPHAFLHLTIISNCKTKRIRQRSQFTDFKWILPPAYESIEAFKPLRWKSLLKSCRYVQDLSSIQYAGGDEIFKEITIHESLIKIIQMSSLSEYQIGIYFPVSDAKLNISARESWQEKDKIFRASPGHLWFDERLFKMLSGIFIRFSSDQGQVSININHISPTFSVDNGQHRLHES